MATVQLSLLVAAALSFSLTQGGERPELVEPATNTRFVAAPRIDAQAYECLGVGVRQKFIFDVYAITFCIDAAAVKPVADQAQDLSHAENNAKRAETIADTQAFFDALATGPHAKLVDLHMVRDVSANSLAKAFRDGLRDVLTPVQLDKVVGAIPGDVSKGTDVRIYTTSDHASLRISVGSETRSIDDPEVARAIWRLWLGHGSVVPTLKKSIARTIADDLNHQVN